LNGEGTTRGDRVLATVAIAASLMLCASCSVPGAIGNGWLDPTVVGAFSETKMVDVRSSLTLEDHGSRVMGATYPTPEDHELIYEEYRISAGDTLAIEVYELRERQRPFQVQLQVSSTGYVNLPVVGQVHASGMTPPEFEQALTDRLVEKQILLDPDVTVQALFLQNATYSIFGIGVSAANTAPLRAGTFPIRTPELRLLEAINQVGGLNEFVTDVYVFRHYLPPEDRKDDPVFERMPPPSEQQQEEPPAADATTPEAEADEPAVADDPADAVLEELLAAVEDAPDAEDQPEADPVEPELRAEEADLRPEPTAPYVFIDGEFVQNPDYVPPDEPGASDEADPFRSDLPAPTAHWARIAGETQYRILQIPADLLRTGDPEANIYVRPGDVIRIVSGEIGIYYVMGQVNAVGRFTFDSEEITLKRAIAAAGGLSSLAWPDRCTIYRRVGRREQMIQVDLDRIFSGKDPDFVIRRGDIINVGTHPFAPFLQRIRAWTLPNPVNDVGYSFTYARNFADIDSFAVQRNPNNVDDSRFPILFP